MSKIYVFVEGVDDNRFFEKIVKPRLEKLYTEVKIQEYRQKSDAKIMDFLRSIEKMGDDYIFVVDIDGFPCITVRKQNKLDTIKGLKERNIYVVKHEIESWYLAGLDSGSCRKFRIEYRAETSTLTKNYFDQLRYIKQNTHTLSMIEMLEVFDINVARKQNASFDYFCKKMCI